jgi:hypothetical protein
MARGIDAAARIGGAVGSLGDPVDCIDCVSRRKILRASLAASYDDKLVERYWELTTEN